MTKNGRGGEFGNGRIFNRRVDFREVENAAFKHAADFRRGEMIYLSTVFNAGRDQTEIGNGRKKNFFISCAREEKFGVKKGTRKQKSTTN